ncbi:MAG TPA: permease [Leucothrix mucor]|uniref:Permease n=1 Tax=Leucothrix mucor TaxID=45248 RepID=A0A7V2WVI2_LEUMU|nr:permease [Leucothrix mucor]
MAKELFLEFLYNFWALLNSIAVFILIGVIIAGVFKLLLPDAFVKKHLGQHNFISTIKAAILGIPLPLCSCSVIPFISALRKSGASKSATQTFLIATPITGADSIMATYGVFGWVFTLYRFISSVVIALIAGFLTLLLVPDDDEKPVDKKTKYTPIDPSNKPNLAYPVGKPLNIKVVKAEDKLGIVRQILSYAFDDIYKDIAKSLMIGIVIGALIVTFMPANLSDYISSNAFINYALVLLISMPLYVCATASIPLGLSLLAAGFSPGAAFIFLTAGPATNTITMSVVLKTLGKTSLIIYLSSVLIGSLLFGYFFDGFFAESLSSINILEVHKDDSGFIAQISSVILLYLSLKYIFNKNTQIIGGGGCSGGGCSSGGCSS